jgi:hypothetical protein
MDETEKLALSNAIISLLLIISEIIGWSTCKSNSISEIFISLLKGNKCISSTNLEEQGQV